MLDLPAETLNAIGFDTWNSKYRWKSVEGKPLDKSVSDTWRRVARHLAEPEPHDSKNWAEKFNGLLESKKFLPAGRILTGAGTGMNTTLFNCFVMGTLEDSMEGILKGNTESMLSLRMGGGIGQDFSPLRPKGAPVFGVNSIASGPLTFMDMWDTGCRTIMGAGTRRGAMMATMRCDHPDIEAFVDAKLDKVRFRNFNLSVLATDDFMKAVELNQEWHLAFGGKVYKTIRARELWNRIMKNTYEGAEPGVIFIDRVNQMNNLWYCETISCSNPCGEQMLPPYGACLLGSINLAALVKSPFTRNATVDTVELQETVALAIRMLDNVVDVSKYPLPPQEVEARNKRRIGLGVTGLANALAMCMQRYGSERAASVAGSWMRDITEAAYETSTRLAEEKGSFPLFDADKYLQGNFIETLPGHIRGRIKTDGIRNSHLTSIAPTGTISLFAGNISSGVEPPFAFEFNRKVLREDGTKETIHLRDYAVDQYAKKNDMHDPLFQYQFPEYFVTAQELKPEEHLRMLAAVQKHVDSSVSKTINLPRDIPFDEFKSVYTDAYALGIKCCTTYRPNDITGSVLEVSDRGEKAVEYVQSKVEEITKPTTIVTELLNQPPERASELPGMTYKLKWQGSDHAMYITINDIIDEQGVKRPYELFINSKNMEHYAWTVALTRMVSAVFRRGGNVRFVVEELKAVFDPKGGDWMNGRYVPSILAAIGGVLEKHMISTGYLDAPVVKVETLDDVVIGSKLGQCPKCGEAGIIRQEGCDKCLACGYSKCG